MDDDYDDNDAVMTNEDLLNEINPKDDFDEDENNPKDDFDGGGDILKDLEEEYGIAGPVDPDEDGGDVLYPIEASQDLSNAIDGPTGDPYVSTRPTDLSAVHKSGTTAIQGLEKTPISELKSHAMVRKSGVKFKRPESKKIPGTSTLKKTYITGDARRTKNFMTKFEYASVIGERATQIEHGARNIDPKVINHVKEKDITSSLDIAAVELEDRSVNFPMSIHREVAPNKVEIWDVRELKLPSEVLCEGHTPDSNALLYSDACPFDIQMSNINILKRFALSNSKI